MRGLRDFKVPNFKFPKFKMKELSEIDEVKVDYDEIKKTQENQKKKEVQNYTPTNYETIQEVFYKSIKENKDRTIVLEKFDPKGKYTEISYRQFGEDVIGFGTALMRKLQLGSNPRVLILSETTYHWYVSYMTMLCGNGIAIPTDKELPDNELENVIKRSRADVVIYSARKEDSIKKILSNIPEVKYFVKMYSEEGIDGKNVGMQYLIEEGKN